AFKLRFTIFWPARNGFVLPAVPGGGCCRMNDLSLPNSTDPAPAPSIPGAEETATGCPRCGGALTNPGSLSWCPACGYCPMLEEKGKQEPRQTSAREPSKLGAAEFFSVVGRTPGWLCLLLGGVLAGFGGSLWAS